MTRKTRWITGIVAIAIAAAFASRHLLLPPVKSTPITADPEAVAGEFDHTHNVLDELLKTHVEDGMVDYKTLKTNPAALSRYLGQLASAKQGDFDGWTQEQQLAMLINLYNAATLKLIIDNYPVDSIKDIGGLFRKPWDIKSLTLFGETITLNHLEHEILRKKYDEPRIHFAIVCAAKGCPALRAEAFTADKLEAQLTDQGEQFLRDSDKNRVDASKQAVYLSKIFDWFEKDFTRDGTLIEYVRPYFSPADAEQLKDGFKVKHTSYDWSLNEQ